LCATPQDVAARALHRSALKSSTSLTAPAFVTFDRLQPGSFPIEAPVVMRCGAFVSLGKVRTAHARVLRNFYSDFTAIRLVPSQPNKRAGCPSHWRTHMEHDLLPGNFLMVFLYLLALLAVRFIN